MDTDIFSSLLFGDEEEAIEKATDKYIKSDEVQNLLETRAFIGAITQILIEHKLTTSEEVEELKKKFFEIIETKTREKIREEFGKLKNKE